MKDKNMELYCCSFNFIEDLEESDPISIHLKKLQHSGLVCRDGKLYTLSKVGRILYSTINKLDRFITAFERNSEFWMEHDLIQYPKGSLSELVTLAAMKSCIAITC